LSSPRIKENFGNKIQSVLGGISDKEGVLGEKGKFLERDVVLFQPLRDDHCLCFIQSPILRLCNGDFKSKKQSTPRIFSNKKSYDQ